jgi:Barrel-sandwich domain of CusB or HlyD membrane-fusion/GAF domain
LDILAQSWLSQQCKIIHGVSRGVVMLGVPDKGSFTPVACWPDDNTASPELLAAAREASEKRCMVMNKAKIDGGFDAIACPLVKHNKLIGIVAVELTHQPEARQRSVIQLLKWGVTWLEMLIEQESKTSQKPLVTVLELIALCLEHRHFQAAATAVVTELATRLSCNRVSVGFIRGHRMHIQALSNTARFDGKTNLARDLASAMEEAVDQDAVLVLPDTGSETSLVTRAHKGLAENHGNASICTVPLVDKLNAVGALTFERPAAMPFGRLEIELCRNIAAMLGPALELKRRDDRWLPAKIRASISTQLKKLFGRRHTAMKLVSFGLAGLLGLMILAEGEYRISADASLEGRVQRSIVAPIDGFIASSDIRAGDLVRAGQLMGAMEDKDLLLEQQKWASQKMQYTREYRNALAEHDRSQVSILSARIDQAKAQLEMVNAQLERTQISAPFEGVVVSGDLSQSLGSPVERGDILFEVAPLDDYRLVLHIKESDIQHIETGQQGELRLAGLPGKPLAFVIDKITPVAETSDGSNNFRVESRLLGTDQQLLPGMEGIGKVAIGQRGLFWIWTHELGDWLRLWAWSWLP